MFNFSEIEEGLFLGSAPELEDIIQNKFEFVLNVSNHYTPSDYLSTLPSEIGVRRVPLEDNKKLSFTLALNAVMELARIRSAKRAVLVHCSAGQSRSPTIVALYLMAKYGRSWEETVRQIKSKRPFVDPHPLLTDEQMRKEIVDRVMEFLRTVSS